MPIFSLPPLFPILLPFVQQNSDDAGHEDHPAYLDVLCRVLIETGGEVAGMCAVCVGLGGVVAGGRARAGFGPVAWSVSMLSAHER